MSDKYNPEIGDYVRHKFDETIKGIVVGYENATARSQVYVKLHDGSYDSFRLFTGNIEFDRETYREYKLKELLCQEK